MIVDRLVGCQFGGIPTYFYFYLLFLFTIFHHVHFIVDICDLSFRD